MAVDAITGKPLWQTNIGSGIIAPPVSYGVDGKQYITIAAGWGGAMGLSSKFTDQINPGTIYTFALDSNKAMFLLKILVCHSAEYLFLLFQRF